jgi:outer membrane protein TolC
MKRSICCALFFICSATLRAETNKSVYPIDLSTVLRLAGAHNLDIEIARQRLAEAKANHGSAVATFFPWLSPGITYKRHDNNIQDVAGNVIEVHKQSYAPGATIAAQVDLGDAIYKELSAKQLVRAADHAVEAQRQQSVASAAATYFDLLAAQASAQVAVEAIKISSNYEWQVGRAVEAGVAFKGDGLRVRVQTERNQLTLRRATEEQRVAAARLAQALHLDPAVALIPQDADLLPTTLLQTNLSTLIAQALTARAELKQSSAVIASTREIEKGATYGPLVPSVGAQAFYGGLGGGKNHDWGNFDEQEDYTVGLSWRIGPGGLFDFDRQHASRARRKIAELSGEQLRDEVTRQVVEAATRVDSMADQLVTTKRAIAAADESLRLAQQRKEFGVGIVLETIQAEQELTRARLDYLKSIAEFDKAQYALLRAVGGL